MPQHNVLLGKCRQQQLIHCANHEVCQQYLFVSSKPLVYLYPMLFLGIFLSMIPALAILRAGTDGALAGVINMVFHDGEPVNYMFFWLTGALSSFLDNAPTYLVFFNTAGGDPVHLMTDMAPTLAAISAGAVFMGANSYIGNAPNFMVRSIAEEQGVAMPSFFGYMAWSVGILIPLFLILTWLFFI